MIDSLFEQTSPQINSDKKGNTFKLKGILKAFPSKLMNMLTFCTSNVSADIPTKQVQKDIALLGGKYLGLHNAKMAIEKVPNAAIPDFMGLAELSILKTIRNDTLPLSMRHWIKKLPPGSKLMIRSSGPEDAEGFTNAGVFETIPNVPANDKKIIIQAIKTVYSSFNSEMGLKQSNLNSQNCTNPCKVAPAIWLIY